MMNEQTAKEFLAEYVQTVKERDDLRELSVAQEERRKEQAEATYKLFEDWIVRLIWNAADAGIGQLRVEALANVAKNTVARIYKPEQDDE